MNRQFCKKCPCRLRMQFTIVDPFRRAAQEHNAFSVMHMQRCRDCTTARVTLGPVVDSQAADVFRCIPSKAFKKSNHLLAYPANPSGSMSARVCVSGNAIKLIIQSHVFGIGIISIALCRMKAIGRCRVQSSNAQIYLPGKLHSISRRLRT